MRIQPVHLSLICVMFLGLLSTITTAHASGDAQALVIETTDKVLHRIREQREQLRAHPDRVVSLVEDLILPHFDFARMARLVLGKHWRTASAQQRELFTREFRQFLVGTYATTLLEYEGQEIRYNPLHTEADSRIATVRTDIVQKGGLSIPLNYRLYHKEEKWMVFDIVVDGVSLINNYRGSFSSTIRSTGIDSLIDELAQQNRTTGEILDGHAAD